MPLKVLKSFDVKYLQILDENGGCDEKIRPDFSKEQIRQFYEMMVLSRIFDDKALALQRQGRLGTYAPVRGQEACQVGSALALEKKRTGCSLHLGRLLHLLQEGCPCI